MGINPHRLFRLWRNQVAAKDILQSLRAQRIKLVVKNIKHDEIAASQKSLLAMTVQDFFGKLLEVQWALQFLERPARHTVRIDHRGPNVAVAKQRLLPI